MRPLQPRKNCVAKRQPCRGLQRQLSSGRPSRAAAAARHPTPGAPHQAKPPRPPRSSATEPTRPVAPRLRQQHRVPVGQDMLCGQGSGGKSGYGRLEQGGSGWYKLVGGWGGRGRWQVRVTPANGWGWGGGGCPHSPARERATQRVLQPSASNPGCEISTTRSSGMVRGRGLTPGAS